MTQPYTQLTLPDAQESALAQRSQQALAAYVASKSGTQRIALVKEDETVLTVELPKGAMALLVDILREMAEGHAVQIVPVQAELTTQEAANMLNVSRPHMVKLLEQGKLPFHKTGRHRRVLFADLIAFKRQREQESLDVMQALADQAQELKI